MWSSLGGRLRQFYASSWFVYVLAVCLFVLTFTFRLGSQPSGLAAAEVTSKAQSQSLQTILNNPVNAPHKIVVYTLLKLGRHSAFDLRLVSILFSGLFLICFYSIARAWFGKIIGLLGMASLALTPFYLIISRQISTEIMFLSTIGVVSAYLWLVRTEDHKDLAFIILILLSMLAIYTPGLILWLVLATALSYKHIAENMEMVSRPVMALASLVILASLVPLGIAAANDLSVLKQLALIPAHLASPLVILNNIGWMSSALFARAPAVNHLIIARLPILNIIQITLIAFGVYAMWSAARLKSLVLILNIIFGIVAAGVNNNLSLLALCLPALGLYVCAGLRYLYIEWRSVFPINPLAKSLAVLLMITLVSVHLIYGIGYSLIAWPHAHTTRQAYVLK